MFPALLGRARMGRCSNVISELSLYNSHGCYCTSQSQAAEPCLTSALFLPGSCTGCAATFSVLKKRVSLQLLPQLAACTWGRCVVHVWLCCGFLWQPGWLASVTAWQQMTSAKCWVLSHA